MIKNILLGVIAIGSYVLSIQYLPEEISNISPTLIAYVISFFSVSCVVFIFFNNLKTDFSKPFNNKESMVILFGFFAWVPLSFIMTSNFDSKVESQLHVDREFTEGSVTSCTKNLSRRTNTPTYTNMVRYITKSGKAFNSSFIDSNCYSNGSKFQVAYSKSKPMLAQVITKSKQKDKLLGISYQKITPKHLIKFLSLENEELGIALNKMSYKWDYSPRENGWINADKNLLVAKLDQSIQYHVYGREAVQLISNFGRYGFMIIEKENIENPDTQFFNTKKIMYKSDKHNAISIVAKSSVMGKVETTLLLTISKK